MDWRVRGMTTISRGQRAMRSLRFPIWSRRALEKPCLSGRHGYRSSTLGGSAGAWAAILQGIIASPLLSLLSTRAHHHDHHQREMPYTDRRLSLSPSATTCKNSFRLARLCPARLHSGQMSPMNTYLLLTQLALADSDNLAPHSNGPSTRAEGAKGAKCSRNTLPSLLVVAAMFHAPGRLVVGARLIRCSAAKSSNNCRTDEEASWCHSAFAGRALQGLAGGVLCSG
ncbi:uncharacterized protein K460DRAFT_357930 [Cucurbitaria berberidis CBS 394.84]|uniref:Uncharacterized protein n=1 Tax=Cucurbitaria berberidis CBS 394.84 TaxID=1168544 RepID=A0A9P4GF59_9PLEO|nr:uncharacterized protein K460DRAFT_357930 [Cucurbitaria berberidis CBS 394.84]KAF1844319.1 hypothetical protein K460DRAFT_357930 [Cucurbitaria berberidis CBS 394.84]